MGTEVVLYSVVTGFTYLKICCRKNLEITNTLFPSGFTDYFNPIRNAGKIAVTVSNNHFRARL